MTLNPNTVSTSGIFITATPTVPSSTMTQNLVSGPINLSKSGSGLIVITWTGTPVGNFTITGSADGINYNIPLVPSSSSTAAGGAAGTLSYQYVGDCKSVVVNYVFGSSTGTWTAAYAATKSPM